MPESISTFGGQIDSLIAFISRIAIPTLILAEAVLIVIVLFFRTRKGGRAPYLAGVGWRQTMWVFLPVFGVVILDFLIDVKTGSAWGAVMRNVPGQGMNVRVTAQQYQWIFTYPGADGILGTGDDFTRLNEFVVPVDSNVIFDLEARDMLHSFWVPALRFKQDAIPGRVIRRWFNAGKTGAYGIACAELCGAGHSMMAATLRVEPKEEFRRFAESEGLKATAAAAQAEAGRREAAARMAAASASDQAAMRRGAELLKAKGCAACHSTDGARLVGPSYKGIAGRRTRLSDGREIVADDAYLARSIRDPGLEQPEGFPAGVMPDLGLSDGEIADIVLYLKTLK